MTPARLAALLEAERRATPGEWRTEWDLVDRSGWLVVGIRGQVADTYGADCEPNAALIALARNELVPLLDTIDRMRALLRVAWGHIDLDHADRGGCECSYCATLLRIDAELEGREG